jgi:hypothetical protein
MVPGVHLRLTVQGCPLRAPRTNEPASAANASNGGVGTSQKPRDRHGLGVRHLRRSRAWSWRVRVLAPSWSAQWEGPAATRVVAGGWRVVREVRQIRGQGAPFKGEAAGLGWSARHSVNQTAMPTGVRIPHPPHQGNHPRDLGKQDTGVIFMCAAVRSPGQPTAAARPKVVGDPSAAHQPSIARPTRSRAACSPPSRHFA